MKKLVLAFPSQGSMAEFILTCKITEVDTDYVYSTLTGTFSEECLKVAIEQFGATISEAPDFILP